MNPLGGPDTSLQYFSDVFPHLAHPAKAGWRAWLVDKSPPEGDLNRYEACLRFTYPESGPRAVTKYHAGGVGVFVDPNTILRVFAKMIWADEAETPRKRTRLAHNIASAPASSRVTLGDVNAAIDTIAALVGN